ncbi:hypothetical protein J4E83_008568 [Alternaria metachromatica]|uniref:uncharacterized protein n=1 Tax=Alternaria metachromatica TaxID=283354 RepID=UPI0020C5AD30|nr:uncharacterized protein J4E83_008568 [Alternaria metachromatica]KAI4610003.1 hypothetical protein J4E83_008568 [Alternaria metachromatica]
MDDNTAHMTSFVLFPVQTIVACNYILHTVNHAILEGVGRGDTAEVGDELALGKSLFEQVQTWPVIQKEHSRCHECISAKIELASFWLKRSPLFDAKKVVILEQYLVKQPGFFASGFKVNNDGLLLGRDSILLKQYLITEKLYSQDCEYCLSDVYMLQYRRFLTELLWAREDPARRMFALGFKGLWQEHSVQTCDKDISQQLEGLDITDDASTIGIQTPSTTRPNSPALTERPVDTTNGESSELGTPLAPMLNYIAVIKTATDEAIFSLDISDVNEKKRRVMSSAQDMCTEMVSKGYEGKVKLQDIMDMAVKMAKK